MLCGANVVHVINRKNPQETDIQNLADFVK